MVWATLCIPKDEKSRGKLYKPKGLGDAFLLLAKSEKSLIKQRLSALFHLTEFPLLKAL